jgi:hypothetical protein
VCIRLGFAIADDGVPAPPFVTEDGRLGMHFELDDHKEVVLDSDVIPWRM